MINSIFDFAKEVTANQNPNLFDSLSEKEQKVWNTFMMNRILSMNMKNIEAINDLQQVVHELDSRAVYRLYTSIFPRDGKYYQYIKNQTPKDTMPEEVLELCIKHYQLSPLQVREYINLMIHMDNYDELILILQNYGIDAKIITKYIKQLSK